MKFAVKADKLYLNEKYGKDVEEIRQQIVGYMKNAPTVLAGGMSTDSQNNEIWSSDGEWLWTQSAALSVESGSIEPGSDFVEYILEKKTPPAELSVESSKQALELITQFRNKPE